MKNYLSIGIKKYFSIYSGLSCSCWQRILLTFINDVTNGIVFFLSLYFVGYLHFDVALAGTLLSFYGVGTALGGVVSGKLSDHISPNFVSIVCLTLKAISFFSFLTLQTPTWLMLNLFVLGLTTYGFKTANYLWVLAQNETHQTNQLNIINILYMAANLGIGLGAVLISTLTHYGFKNIFILSGLLLAGSALFLAYQEIFGIHKKPVVPVKAIIAVENTSTMPIKFVALLVLTCLFLVGLIIAQVGTTYSIYLQETFPQKGITGIGILFLLNTLMIVILQTPFIQLLKRFNHIFLVGIGALMIGVGMCVLSFSFNFSLAIVSCVIYTFGEMLFIAMAQLVFYQYGSVKKKGQTLGLFQSVYALSLIAGPVIGGGIYHQFGGNMVWYLSGIIGIACFAACTLEYFVSTKSWRPLPLVTVASTKRIVGG